MWCSSLGLILLTLTCFEVSANYCIYQSIRLDNTSNTPNSGNLSLLQICNSSRNWSAVCDYDWGCTQSFVACKQLGYTNPTRIEYKVQFGPTDYISVGPYTSCLSSYATLFSCSSSSSNRFRYCSPFINTIGLKCKSMNLCTNGEVRLVNGQSTSSMQGRVEYCYEGEWSAFSIDFSNYFSPAVAYAFCYELGYTQNSYASIFTDGRFGKKSSQYRLQYMSCSNNGASLSQCTPVTTSSYPTCLDNYNSNDIGIHCYEPVGCNEGDIRLVNGTFLNEGRLEVCSNGVWGSVCSDFFRFIDAIIVCRDLEYDSGGTVTTNSAFSDGDVPIVFTNVGCDGSEKKFSDCYKGGYFSASSCSRSRTVGVFCWDGCTNGNIRLSGGSSSHEGTVEICYNSIWGLIQRDGWDTDDAKVVCDQLGYETEDAEPLLNSEYGKPNRPIWYSNVRCDGLEDELGDCTSTLYSLTQARNKLPSAVVAGVRCQGNEMHSSLISDLPVFTSISTSNLTGTHVVTPTLYFADPGLSSRERAILGVGGTMIGVAIICVTAMIVVMVCFIVRQKRSRRSADLEPLTQQKTKNIESHQYVNKTTGGVDRGVHHSKSPNAPPTQKSRGKLPKPPVQEVEELYELS